MLVNFIRIKENVKALKDTPILQDMQFYIFSSGFTT